MNIIFTFFIAFYVGVSFSQDTIITYYNAIEEQVDNIKDAKHFKKTIQLNNEEWYIRDYYLTGILQSEGTYLLNDAEKKNGIFKYYNKSGALISQGRYENNKEEGEWLYYYDTGQLKGIENYLNGKQNGECKWYYVSGKLAASEYYNSGEITELKYYDEIGNLLKGDLKVEEHPLFPGGDLNLRKWFAEQIKYPEVAKIKNITGTVYLRFLVDIHGMVSEVEIQKGVDPLLNNEAVRVIKSLPEFKPGKKHNLPSEFWYSIPIKFDIN